MIKVVHISDTHGFHERLQLPECDILIHSGDVGDMRTTLSELNLFLIWFSRQPAPLKIFVAGNHDVVLDKYFPDQQNDPIGKLLALQNYRDAKKLIEGFPEIKYLENKDYVFTITNTGKEPSRTIKIYGSPYSPRFGTNWAFNANRGDQIKNQWAKIPSDVDILITHTPVYNILDHVEERYKRYPDEDMNVGCQDLFDVMKKRLHNLKLHCSGHIHDQYGMVLKKVSNTRRVLFSNGAVIDNDHNQLVTIPPIIYL